MTVRELELYFYLNTVNLSDKIIIIKIGANKGPDYMSQAASVRRDDFQPGIAYVDG